MNRSFLRILGMLGFLGVTFVALSVGALTAQEAFPPSPTPAAYPPELENQLAPNDPSAIATEFIIEPASLGKLSILSDGQFPYGPNVGDFKAQKYLEEHAPHLIVLGDYLDSYGDYYSINPRIYLTLIEMQTGLVSSDARIDQIQNPFQLAPEGIEEELVEISEIMVDAFYNHRDSYSALSPEARNIPPLRFAGSNAYPVPDSLNAGSYAVYAALSQLKTNRNEMRSAVSLRSSKGFMQTYRRLFPDSEPLDQANRVSIPGMTTVVPPVDLLQLPYPRGEAWIFGPVHAAGGKDVSSVSSIDLAKGGTNWPPIGTNTDGWYAVSAHSGTVVSITGDANRPKCQIRLKHSSGWQTVYLHVDRIQVSVDQTIDRSNIPLGNVADTMAEAKCFEDARWTNPHLHFTLREPSGAVAKLDGTWLSGWKLINKRTTPTYDTCPTNVMWFEKGWSRKRYCLKSGQPEASLQLRNDLDNDEYRRISAGQTLNGKIAGLDSDLYIFRGQQGQALTVRMQKSAGSPLDPWLYIYGPDGSPIQENNDSDGTKNSRITFTPATTGDFVIIADRKGNTTGNYILTLSTTTATNLALNRPAFATSQDSAGNIPTRANDGNQNTRWSSAHTSNQSQEEWWWVDLGSVRTFNQVKINWEIAYATSYSVAWSDTTDCYGSYTGRAYTNSSTGWKTHNLGTRSARCIAVVMQTKRAPYWNYSFWELEAYNVGALTLSLNSANADTSVPQMNESPVPDFSDSDLVTVHGPTTEP